MKFEVIMSFSEKVEIELTEHGYEVYSKYCTRKQVNPLPKTNMKFYFALSQIANVFGNNMCFGTEDLFVNNEFRIII